MLPLFRHASLAATTALLLAAAPVAAQPVNQERLVAVVLVAKIPPGTPRATIDQGILASVPTYQKIPGLVRKAFTVNADSYGGMYLWSSRAAAEAWFTPAFIAQVKARTGAEPQITYYDSDIQIDNRATR